MNETSQAVGNHSMEFLEPTWLRVSFPCPEQLPPAEDIVVPQKIPFNDRKSHWAYNDKVLGPFTQSAGPPPKYQDQPVLVQYHPLYWLFDENGAYNNDRTLRLECEHTVEAATFDQQSLWQANEQRASDGNLLLAYQTVMQFLKTPDGGWVRAQWIGAMAPTVKNMGWMIGGLALGDSVIGPDAVLHSGKVANSRLHGKSVIDTKAGIVAHSILDQTLVYDMSEIRHSSLHGATITNAKLSNVACDGEITIQDVELSDVALSGSGVIRRSDTTKNDVTCSPFKGIEIEGDVSIKPIVTTKNPTYVHALRAAF